MDQTKALVKLVESADLIRMLEDLVNPNLTAQLSPAALGGIRVTLRNVRDSIVHCHEALATSAKADASYQPQQQRTQTRPPKEISPTDDYVMDPESVEFMTKSGQHQQQVRRGDLRSSLAKMVERT